ncbi:MAG TPA: hypothetical protein VGD67_15005 [Pseudonocardiaceae bacterium]
MIRSIAVVPHPPLLVPELMGAAAAEAEPVRRACQQAIRGLGPGPWHAVGADPAGPLTVPSGARASFRGYGVDVAVTLGVGPPGDHPGLPLPLLVAAWLSEQAAGPVVTGEVVPPSWPADTCLARGRELAAADGERALLVLGDGARTHDVPGAGRVDARAVDFDRAVAVALASADAGALAALDAGLAEELGAGGRAAWQVLAGAAEGRRWAATSYYDAAPYGVGYHVALWRALP